MCSAFMHGRCLGRRVQSCPFWPNNLYFGLVQHAVLCLLHLSVSECGYMCTVCSSVLSVPGSRSATTSVLAELQKLLQAEATLEEKENQLADISQQIQKIEKAAAKYV